MSLFSASQVKPAQDHPFVQPDTLDVALITICVDQDIIDQISQSIGEISWAVSHGDYEQYISANKRPHFAQQLTSARACLAIIDFDKDWSLAIEATEYLNQVFFGKVEIVALSSRENPDLLLKAMRAGCSEFLRKPLDSDQFTETLARLQTRWARSAVRPSSAGRILSFFGAKGGVGTTSIAVHLAMFLVRDHHKKVLLIDNHPQLGHVCLYLGVDGTRYYFHELIRNVDRLDSELLLGFIATHPSGLDVLASPEAHGEMRHIDPDSINRTLEFLRGEYDYILLDCASGFDENNLTVIDRSDQVYLIGTPEIGAIRDLSRCVDGLAMNGKPPEKIQVVINRFSSREAVSAEQIEKAIKLPLVYMIPNNYAEMVRSINVGDPISSDRKSEFTLKFAEWANALTDTKSTQAVVPQKRRFSFWH